MKPSMKIRVATVAFVVLSVFALVPGTASAQQGKVSVVTTEVKPEIQVKFLGATGDYLFFELNVSQLADTRSQLRIRTEDGTDLYTENLYAKTATRKVKISKDDASKLEFSYNTLKGDAKKTVEVNIRFQESIEVKDITPRP